MNKEYVIIDKTAIQEVIERLEKINDKELFEHMELDTLKYVLSQSTPLIPEIEKAWKTSKEDVIMKDYINNLKLDI